MPSPTLGSVCMNSKVNGGKILSIQKIDEASHFFRSKRAFLEKFPTNVQKKENIAISSTQTREKRDQTIRLLTSYRKIEMYQLLILVAQKTQIAFMTSVRSNFSCAMNKMNGCRTNFSNRYF